jgi:ribonuclease Y
MNLVELAIPLALLVVGIVLGVVVGASRASSKHKKAEQEATEKLNAAQKEAQETVLKAQREAMRLQDEAKKEEQERRTRLDSVEKKLEKKEEQLDQKTSKLERDNAQIESAKKNLEQKEIELDKLKGESLAKLEQVAQLTYEEAREKLLKEVEDSASEDIAQRLSAIEERVKEEADEKAKNIIVHSIQKYSSEVVSDSTVTILQLPSDDMKGRIIGREGRNIQAFEKVTGVDVIVDDAPGTIVLSGFDLVRRYVAKLAMESLILDGRIHPTRIEEAAEKARNDVARLIKEFGEKALFETGIAGLHPDLTKILGRLRFRTSYGQNVLKHSVEVAFIASALAEEIGADTMVVKKGGLLHDIGKAVDHEITGPHALIGRDIAKKFNVSDAVVHAIEAHHEDVPPTTLEALLVQAADAISASRPGARRESLESYIKRLENLEEAANSFAGVDKAYAIQAGREVRVIVHPDDVTDAQATKLARQIADKIEQELEYPGQIKVNVLREKRVIEFAK